MDPGVESMTSNKCGIACPKAFRYASRVAVKYRHPVLDNTWTNPSQDAEAIGEFGDMFEAGIAPAEKKYQVWPMFIGDVFIKTMLWH
ncbi:hypothetical protein CCHR01_01883 [Colletotrichum chrysophilum]|uniref:Uncharacterized protein n=1 Tax=Colletotrichum chrysophilum TaxID=1836956 RepID=A0AAD9AY48_9PEZI|nr:hypothetical protein CCHR01_01883 [Colletotrichum chrysophilum]